MTFPSASSGSPGDPFMASLATNAVRTRFALTRFLSTGGEDRLTHVRDLLRQVIQSAHDCGLTDLAFGLSRCEETLATEGNAATINASAIDGALRALAPRAERPRVADAPIFADGDGTAPAPAPVAAVEAPPPPALGTVTGSPLELVLLATECASSAKAGAEARLEAPIDARFELDDDRFEVDDSDTDVDDAPVFERSVPIKRPSLLLSLTPPPIRIHEPFARTSTLTPPPHAVVTVFVPPVIDPVATAEAMDPEPDAITAVVVPRAPLAPPAAPAVHAQAAFVSAEVLASLASNDVLLAPPMGARADQPSRATDPTVLASPLDRVRAAYLILAILLGLLLGFAARTLVTAGTMAAVHAAPALMVAPQP